MCTRHFSIPAGIYHGSDTNIYWYPLSHNSAKQFKTTIYFYIVSLDNGFSNRCRFVGYSG